MTAAERIHDAYARFTPYEVSIPGRGFVDRHFAKIRDEAGERDIDPSDPGAFVMLAATGAALREIRGEEDAPGLIEQYAELLFHGFHGWLAGEPLYLVDLRVARFVVESEPEPDGWSGALPDDAGYLQLPRHLFWAHTEGDDPVEPVDGLFWTRSAASTLSLLTVTGMREDRPGLSVIPLPPVPIGEVIEWGTEHARDEEAGGDFEGVLPGAELDRLYSIVTPGEILKLAALLFGYIERFPSEVREETLEPGEGERRPLPSSLPYRRVALDT